MILSNPKRERFAQEMARGGPNAVAWRVYAEVNGATERVSKANATRWMENAGIKARIKEIQAEAAKLVELEIVEALKFCADIIRTPVGEVNESHPLAQEVTRDLLASEEGESVKVREKVKLPDKLKALDILAKFKGWYAPEKQAVEHSFNQARLAQLMGVES